MITPTFISKTRDWQFEYDRFWLGSDALIAFMEEQGITPKIDGVRFINSYSPGWPPDSSLAINDSSIKELRDHAKCHIFLETVMCGFTTATVWALCFEDPLDTMFHILSHG